MEEGSKKTYSQAETTVLIAAEATARDVAIAAEATARGVAIATHASLFGLHSKIIRKTADQTVNNSTTVVNDTELLFAVGANEVWVFDAFLLQNSGEISDIKLTFKVPSGGTVLFASTADGAGAYYDAGDEYPVAGLARDVLIRLFGTVINGSTAGNIQLQWAQNTQNASNTKLLANSYIIAHRVA